MRLRSPAGCLPNFYHVAQALIADGGWWVKEWDEETIAFLEPAGKEWRLDLSRKLAGIIDALWNGAIFLQRV